MYYLIISLILAFFTCLLSNKEIKKYGLNNKYLLLTIPLILILFIHNKNGWFNSIFIGATIPLLISLTYIDIKFKEIPHSLTISIFIIGALQLAICFFSGIMVEMIVPKLMSSLVLFITYLLLSLLSRGGLGMGDCYLMTSIGLFIPIRLTPILLTQPITYFTTFAIIMLILKKATLKSEYPFAPFIMISLSFLLL